MLPAQLKAKLNKRANEGLLRTLPEISGGVDFFSNDYLGLARWKFDEQDGTSGATGSRLLSGNHPVFKETEDYIAQFHNAQSALIFPSGYVANLALLGTIAQRNDTILYDQEVHASIRDGIQLSKAASHAFRHNDLVDLKKKLTRSSGTIYVVTESVFSMGGPLAPIEDIAELCRDKGARLIVDEAHALGVFGDQGQGLVQQLGVEKQVFARVFTYGKALGSHGAAVLSDSDTISFLINFARPFIYTTAMPPSSASRLAKAYAVMSQGKLTFELKKRISQFHEIASTYNWFDHQMLSESAIQSFLVEGNERVNLAAKKLQEGGFQVLPIRYPTVAKGKERLRISLHSFNTEGEMKKLLGILNTIVNQD